MLPFAVSLKAGSITGVPMSPGYGGHQSTTPPPYYTTTTFAKTGYYTEAQYYYTTKAPEYYTEADAAPSYNIKRTTPRLQSTKTTKSPEYYTYVAPACCTEAPKYYLVPIYYTEAPTYYTTKAAEYYTEPPKYYTNKAPEYYPTSCASPSLYTEAPKYYSALSYTTTTEAAKYYAAATYYTAAAPSYYDESEYYTLASVYYTTTYATPRPLCTTLPTHLSIITLFTLLRPITPKFRSITPSRVTTPLRHLNITPHLTLLQLTTGTLLNIITMFRFVGHILIVSSHWELLIFNREIIFLKPR